RRASAVLSMVTDRFDSPAIESLPGLRVISNLAVGVDNIDLAAATRAGIPVGHTPGVLTETTADLALDRERKEIRDAQPVSLKRLLTESHFVSLHVPLTTGTLHMIGAAELAMMKRSAILINTARGPIVDQGALASALRAGRIAAAGLDVTDPEPI